MKWETLDELLTNLTQCWAGDCEIGSREVAECIMEKAREFGVNPGAEEDGYGLLPGYHDNAEIVGEGVQKGSFHTEYYSVVAEIGTWEDGSPSYRTTVWRME